MYVEKIRSEKGSALLVTLTLIGMVSLLGLIAINNSVTETDLSFNKVHLDDAYYIAQAGARRGMVELKANPDWRAGINGASFGNGQFSVVIVDSMITPSLADTVLVRATGSRDGARASIEYWCTRGDFQPFKYAMFAKTMIDIKNGLTTDSYNSDSGSFSDTYLTQAGDVGSNNLISVDFGAYIGGDVSSAVTGGATVSWGATVTGTVADDAPEQDIPSLPQEEFDWAESVNAASTGISGDYSYNAATGVFKTDDSCMLQSGVYFFNEMTLTNSASVQVAPGAEVTIYVSGDIHMMNSSEVNEGGAAKDMVIYSQGDLVLKNSGDISAVFYSPDGTADMRNSGDFYGSIVANDIICHNSAAFHYDRGLGNIIHEGAGDYAVVAARDL